MKIWLLTVWLFLPALFADEVKVGRRFYHDFPSYFDGLTQLVPERQDLFVYHDGLNSTVLTYDLREQQLFCYCARSVGSVGVFDGEGKPLQNVVSFPAKALVAGAHSKADGSIVDNFEIATKEVVGYWFDTNDAKVVAFKIKWENLNNGNSLSGDRLELKVGKDSKGKWTLLESRSLIEEREKVPKGKGKGKGASQN